MIHYDYWLIEHEAENFIIPDNVNPLSWPLYY
jgi:hypothetical protein